jgi:hypothetical protein
MLAGAANLSHAAHTRRVSAAGLALLQAKLPQNSSQIARGRIRRFESDMPSQTVRLSTLLRALDRAAFLGARDREAVRAGDMGKGLALI